MDGYDPMMMDDANALGPVIKISQVGFFVANPITMLDLPFEDWNFAISNPSMLTSRATTGRFGARKV